MARPATWEDPDAFDKAVDEYFKLEIRHTWTGLAIHLGFESRKSLDDYHKKEGFSYSVKKALIRIENIYEGNLFQGNPAGSIFALKNFGWKDKQEIEQATTIKDERITDEHLTDADRDYLAALQLRLRRAESQKGS